MLISTVNANEFQLSVVDSSVSAVYEVHVNAWTNAGASSTAISFTFSISG